MSLRTMGMHAVLCISTPRLRAMPARALGMLSPGSPGADELAALVGAVAQCGDRAAFATLFRALAPRVKGFLVRSGADPGVAEDLTQEALVQVWRKAATFDSRRGSVATWIFTIARNLWIDQCRRALTPAAYQERAGWLADLPELATTNEDLEPVLGVQRQERVRAVLAGLPPEQAEAVRMAYFGEATHENIAAVLGIPLGTVKSRIRRAIATLRERLDGSEL